MKKPFLYFLLLALLLKTAIAETAIFSGKAITDTDKVIEGGIFKFKYDETSDKVFVQTPTTSLIVDNGACKSNDVFRVCINSANFSHKNITTYVHYYEVDATIYKLTGSLSTVTKAASTTLLQGESAELSVTITNPTDFDITKIVFSYNLTPFYIYKVEGCSLNERQMAWNGSLKPRYDKACTATIAAEKEGTYSLAGDLSYFNGFETEKKKTDSVVIRVLPKQLKAVYIIDKGIEIKKPFYINISLQNIHASEDIEAFTTIGIPNHISLIKDNPAFAKDGKVLKHSSVLKPGNMVNYSLYLEAISHGQEPINYKHAYTIKGIGDLIENNTFVNLTGIQASWLKEQEPDKNASAINAVTEVAIQSPAAIIPNETDAATAYGNKTTEQGITANYNQKPEFSNKKILLPISAALMAFLALFFIINRVRKRKKESTELMEKPKEETNSNE